MAWFFASILCLMLGAGLEGHARRSPALRPAGPALNLVWNLASRAAAVLLVIAFVWALFHFERWAGLALFAGAFVLNVLIYSRTQHAGAAPGLSMLLLLIGIPLTVLFMLSPPTL